MARKAARTVPGAVGVYVVVLLSLQIFLLMVCLEAFLTHDVRLAWVTAGTSLALAATAGVLYRYLRAVGRP